MQLREKQLRRLVEKAFPNIEHFHSKVTVDFEKLENAKSFWSEIFLARLRIKHGSEDVHALPDTVFIKIPRISENVLRCEDGSAVDQLQQTLDYYSRKENLFYKHFAHGSIANFPFPKVYYTEDIDGEATGGLVAENLSAEVFAVEHIPGLNGQQVNRLVEALAGFHAHLMKRDDKEYVTDFEEGAHGREVFAEGMQNMMFEEALRLETVDPQIFGNGRIQKIGWSFDYENKNKALAEAIRAIPGILAHADLNVTNILWQKDSPTDAIRAVIDFQMVLVGSVAHDIIRILTLGLGREERRRTSRGYLEHYHRTLAGFFDGKPPFSLDELHHEYNHYFPFSSNFALFGISLYIKMYADGTLGTADSRQANCDELVDRARGIVEDIEALKQ
ncbi:unnamed protein product [Caenorhabditis sp. 36 PRJEB53466]|nr:unnamed protein product [Caenorhabditis sp. 36 PRJEB53466]